MSDPTPGGAAEFPAGIRCPRCGGTRWEVYRTSTGRDRILRVRKCRGCGKQIPTVEILARDAGPGAGSPTAA